MTGLIVAMRRVPPFLAAVAMVALAIVTMSPAPATAEPVTAPAKCPAFVLSDAVEEPMVFHARVTGAGKATKKGGPVVYPVTVVKALKGVTGGSNLKVALNPGVCQKKSLTAYEDYYFFVQKKGDTILAAGTQPRVEEYSDKLQAEIAKEFPEVIAPEPQQVSFSEPASPEGQQLVKVAAPGFVLVGVGLLGLLIVQILGRRKTA
ncbi:hypothetical protein [Nocardioides panzhihuensis]|uniref:Preprotein translocase subunit Sss1 n=1 Tax=Nocardioides panzhihuensis TaxID=860243 RepID=A0A7Z0IUX9_9ACTN|nr:hypothetical protein [Nocardioides panzhihuensis]NYI80437.1 preprotein translocase subunit Sss1 [Nocardioides panzhihuensis]